MNRVNIKKFFSFENRLINYCITLIVIYFFIRFQNRAGIKPFTLSAGSAFFILYSLFTANILTSLIDFIFRPNFFLRLIFHEFLIFLYMFIFTYHQSTRTPLDLFMVLDNAGIGFEKESFQVIFSILLPKHVIATFIMLILYPALYFFVNYKRFNFIRKYHYKKLSILFILYLIILLIPLKTYDDVTDVLKQSVDFYILKRNYLNIEGFPYITNSIKSGTQLKDKKSIPNIFLILVESYNANLNFKKSENGVEYTPVFNALVDEGLFVERFYGNSIQTAKGQAAILLSVIPSTKGKIFTSFPSLRFKALPEFLSERGYFCLFMQGSRNVNFDNTENFLKKSGFSEVRSIFDFAIEADQEYLWGWGYEDKVLYQRTLEYLDKLYLENKGVPFFVMLMTASNHQTFDKVPESKRKFYKNPQNYFQRYANSIYISDSQLPDLIEGIRKRAYLKNSIIIITSDHSFPLDEHGIHHNESGFYDESFRIPLLMLWDGHIKPEKIKGPFSQVDLAPTILDMIGVREVKNHFVGRSIFSKNDFDNTIFLVQPHSGQYLSVVKYPYKYIKNIRSGRELIFNLEVDPCEKIDLSSKISENIKFDLQRALDRIVFNQSILEQNKLWDE